MLKLTTFKKRPAMNAHRYALRMFETLVIMGVKIDSVPEKVGTKFVRTEIYPRRMIIHSYKVKEALKELHESYESFKKSR